MATSQHIRSLLPTIELLAERWSGAGPLLPGFALLAQGRPVTVAEIAAAAGVDISQVESSLEAARCERDSRGHLIDLYGLTLTPTHHRLTIGNKILFGCCALWAHVIPKLVDARIKIESVDPYRHESIRLLVSADGIESATPSTASATLALANREGIDADVSAAFCAQVRHFVSRESAEEFAAGLPTCHVISLSELQEAADFLYQSIWSTVEE